MCQPDIGGTIGPDVFIGCPEGPAIGRIEHYRAVIAYPRTIVFPIKVSEVETERHQMSCASRG